MLRRSADTLEQVNTMQEHGAIAAARPTDYQAGRWYIDASAAFTDLARALLITCVEVSSAEIAVFTPFDTGTSLYRSLRVRQIREEIAALQCRQQELTEELTGLNSEEQNEGGFGFHAHGRGLSVFQSRGAAEVPLAVAGMAAKVGGWRSGWPPAATRT